MSIMDLRASIYTRVDKLKPTFRRHARIRTLYAPFFSSRTLLLIHIPKTLTSIPPIPLFTKPDHQSTIARASPVLFPPLHTILLYRFATHALYSFSSSYCLSHDVSFVIRPLLLLAYSSTTHIPTTFTSTPSTPATHNKPPVDEF